MLKQTKLYEECNCCGAIFFSIENDLLNTICVGRLSGTRKEGLEKRLMSEFHHILV